MHVVIRADGGPDIGYGHLMRTGALAEELLNNSHRVTYATTTPSHVAEVSPEGTEWISINSQSEPSALLEDIEFDFDVAVVDSYLADADYQEEVRAHLPTVVISDDTRHPICADVAVNGNLYAKELEYDVIGDEPNWCLGPDFLLLRRSIAQLANEDPPWRDPPERALITMGGSDIANITPVVIRAFNQTELHIDAIIGPGFSDRQESEVLEAASTISTNVVVNRDPVDLPERMLQADFAVSTASSTIYELLSMGTPTVCQPVVTNQAPIAKALHERDIATVLSRGEGEEAFQSAIKEHVMDATLRRERQRRGRDLIDGRGAKRTVEVIHALS